MFIQLLLIVLECSLSAPSCRTFWANEKRWMEKVDKRASMFEERVKAVWCQTSSVHTPTPETQKQSYQPSSSSISQHVLLTSKAAER